MCNVYKSVYLFACGRVCVCLCVQHEKRMEWGLSSHWHKTDLCYKNALLLLLLLLFLFWINYIILHDFPLLHLEIVCVCQRLNSLACSHWGGWIRFCVCVCDCKCLCASFYHHFTSKHSERERETQVSIWGYYIFGNRKPIHIVI